MSQAANNYGDYLYAKFGDARWYIRQRANRWMSNSSTGDYYKNHLRWQAALSWRFPAFLAFAYGWQCNFICYQLRNAPGGREDCPSALTTEAKLLDIGRVKNLRLGLPRYWVKYEYWVDGVRYESKRATTGTPYRNWMGDWYLDTITESQYLQAMPVLRVGEKCAVWYHKKYPADYSAIAFDGNSFETGTLICLGGFPLFFGGFLRAHMFAWRAARFPRPLKVKMPDWSTKGQDHSAGGRWGNKPEYFNGPK